MLNLDTLLLVQVCVTLLTTALLIAAACYTDSPPEQRWWAGGNVVISLGLALSNLDSLPVVIHSAASYGVIGLGLGMVLRGLRVHCQETLSWRWVVLMAAVAGLVPAYYTFVTPSLQARLCFSGFYFGACNWLCAATLARHGSWRGTAASVIGFTMLGLALMLRGLHMLVNGGAPADDASSRVMALSTLMIPLGQICIAFGLTLLVMWRYAERLRRLSALDPLTGALNRGGLEVQGKRVCLRALKARRSMAVIMIDVDHFKVINDTYGHPVGDEVLRHLAGVLKLELRPADLLARLGGEEFVLVLDGLDRTAAASVAERLRARIEAEQVQVEQQAIRYTASVGVVSSAEHDYDLIRLISAGDAAMYAAKRAGRNRVVCG